MRNLVVWGMLGVVCACWPACASAKPGSGPRETVDQRFTAKRPNAASGATFTGVYHAAGNAKGSPPYMRRMTFYPPKGTRYDTSVPERCTASDLELEVRGMAACPAGSRIGGGTTSGLFFEPIAHSFSSPYDNALDIVNAANEQVLVIQTPGGYTVARGQIRPDQSVEFASPTCFPAPPEGQQCAVDNVLQLGSKTSMAPYTRMSRSYLTTPPKCPARGFWRARIRFWWADGSVDTVATDSPGKRRRAR